MKPVCVPCQRFFRPKKNGFPFIEAMPISPARAAPGTAEPEKWTPYKLWMGDLWECQGCGTTIIVGVGHSPLAERYEPNFEDRAVLHGARLQVNDC